MTKWHQYRPWRGHVITLLAVALAVAAATAVAAENAAKVAPVGELPSLADTGRFDQVLAALKADQGLGRDPQVAALMHDLELHEKHDAEHTAKRREAFDKSYKQMVEDVAAGKLEEAMVSAVETHGLADDGDALLKDEKVVALVKTVADTAAKAEQAGDWLDAMSLYRTLDLLFENKSKYRGHVKNVERHVRLLRLYAPQELQRLYSERAKRQGNDKAEPIKLGDETWQQTLADIEGPMLRQTITRAAHHHVSDPGYTPLLLGAIDGVMTMLDTKGLEKTFPSLGDAQKTDAFRKGMADIRKDIESRKEELHFLDAAMVLDKITNLNGATINLPEPVMVYELSDGAMAMLDDFTAVIWPTETEHFARNTQGKFYGVGIQISRRDGRLVVVSPLESTPAQRAGVKAGDIIAKVDGVDTSDWTLDRAVREITGPEGTDVSLGMQRTGKKDLIDFKITRAEIIIESIRGWQHRPAGGWDYFIDKTNKIGYVRLSQFIPQTRDDLDAAVNQMQDEGGINGLILDLRFDPGGLLSSAIDVVDRFISDGVIVSTVDATGRPTSQPTANAAGTYPKFPVVVLVNQGSASASEIVSGALQDYARALIVGQRSFGKGSVQDLYAIQGRKAYLKLTTQYYKLPKGRIIHRKPGDTVWGIEPDLHVKMTSQQVADMIESRQAVDVLRDANEKPAEDAKGVTKASDILKKSLDPQLEAALLVLQTRLVAHHIAVARRDEPVRTP